MKRFLLTLCALCATTLAWADEWTSDNGITLTYSISSNTATITGCANASGELIIPEKLGGYPVTTIGDRAFYYCTSLTSITIPEGVVSIGRYAFNGCSGLTSITIPESVRYFHSEVFCGCEGLTSVVIPKGVTELSLYLFSGCSNLTSVVIPEGVTSIERSAFSDCSSLTSITIPASVEFIGNGAFSRCISLASITFEGLPPELDRSNVFLMVPAIASYPPQYAEEWQHQIKAGKWDPLTFVLEDVLVFTDIVGNGSVTTTEGATGYFPKGETKTLTAVPAEGYVFMGWSGDVISTDETITLSGENVEEYNLNVQFLPKSLLEAFVGTGSGGGSTSGGLTESEVDARINALIAAKLASGDLVSKDGAKADAKTEAEAVVDEKVETKEIVTKQQIKDLSLKTPVIDVTDGEGTISFALQKSTNLSDEDAWEEVDVANPSVDTDGNVTIAIAPEEDEDTAFYKFVIPNEQGQ